MQHESAQPYNLRYFDIFKQARVHNKEYIANCEAAKASLNKQGVITLQFNTFVKAAEEANDKSIERLSTYGHEFLNTYIEPMILDTEESLNALMGLTVQYEYRDVCHTKEWDWQHFRAIKNNIATLSVGIKANSSLRNKESHSPDDTLSFDELYQLIRQMWSIHPELMKLANRLSDMTACFEDWKNKRDNNP